MKEKRKNFKELMFSLSYLKLKNMIYFFIEIHMENQINMGDQNTQQIGQNPISQPVKISEKPKINYWMVSTIILFFALIGGCFYTFSLMNKIARNGQNIEQTNIQRPTNSTGAITEPEPTISNKKVYSNQIYNFSISAPEGFEIAESPFEQTSILNVIATNQIPIGKDSWNPYPKESEIKINLWVMKKNPKNDTWGWGSFNVSNDIYQKLMSLTSTQSFEIRSDLFYSAGVKDISGIKFQMFRTGPNIGYPGEHVDSVGAVGIKSDTTFFLHAVKGTSRTTDELKQSLDKTLLTLKFL